MATAKKTRVTRPSKKAKAPAVEILKRMEPEMPSETELRMAAALLQSLPTGGLYSKVAIIIAALHILRLDELAGQVTSMLHNYLASVCIAEPYRDEELRLLNLGLLRQQLAQRRFELSPHQGVSTESGDMEKWQHGVYALYEMAEHLASEITFTISRQTSVAQALEVEVRASASHAASRMLAMV